MRKQDNFQVISMMYRYLTILLIITTLLGCVDGSRYVALTPAGEWSPREVAALQAAAEQWSATGCVDVVVSDEPGASPVRLDRVHPSAPKGAIGYFDVTSKEVSADAARIATESRYSLKSVLAHEIGHRLGAGPEYHSDDPTCVMGRVPTPGTVICQKAKKAVCEVWANYRQ